MGVGEFLFELGQLKRVKRSGWWLSGVKDPESVAEHSFRAGMIGYILAKMEGADPAKVVLASLANDLHEARLNDLHKLGHRYIDFKEAEKAAFAEQVSDFPEFTELIEANDEFQNQSSREGIIARDADLLECAVQAREYQALGHDTASWIDNTEKLVKTDSAKKILNEIKSKDPYKWSQSLKKIER